MAKELPPRPLDQLTRFLGEGALTVELLSAHRFDHPTSKGQSGHRAPYCAFQFVQKGSTRYRVGTARLVCRPGDVVMISPGVTHDYHHEGGTQGFYLSFYFHHRVAVSPPDPCLHLHQAWNLLPTVKSLMLEKRRENPYQALRLRSLFTLLFSSMLLLQKTTRHPTRPFSDSRAESILAHISRAKYTATSSDQLARALHLSRPYFTRVFRQTFGVSLRVFQMRERLRRAALVLSRENLTVAEVAAQFGYSSIPSFCRQYVKLFGESPGRHRGG